MADFPTGPDQNFGPDTIKTEVINAGKKGIQYNTPMSRFTSVRKPIVLEWVPLDAPGKFGRPIRTALLINPETLDFNRQHVYSQQQTRGGWIHTHWGDKPMTISVRGNTGLFQYDFIHRLEYFSRVNGKSYAELEALTSKANQKNRDYILSQYLGADDAKVVQDLIQSTTLPGQTLLKDFLTNDAFYQKATVLGASTFRDVPLVSNITNIQQKTQVLLSDLEIIRKSQNQQILAQKPIGINAQFFAPISDNQLVGPINLTAIANTPANRLEQAIFNVLRNQGIIPSYIPPVSYSLLMLNGLPGALINTINPNNQTSNYGLLQNFLTKAEFGFLSGSSNTLSNFSNQNLRLDNPLQFSQSLLSTLGSNLFFYQTQSTNLLGAAQSLLSMLSTPEEDLLNELITSLTSYINTLNELEDELTVLKRQIKIQIKKFDTTLLENRLARLQLKIQQAEDDIQSIMQTKDQLDDLLPEPLSTVQVPSEQEQALSKQIAGNTNVQAYLGNLVSTYQIGYANGPALSASSVFDRVSNDYLSNPGAKNFIRSYNLAINGVDSSNFLNNDSLEQQKFLGYTIGRANQGILSKAGFQVVQTPTGFTTIVDGTKNPALAQSVLQSKADTNNTANTTAHADTILTTAGQNYSPNLSVTRDAALADKFQNQQTIFDVKNGQITPSKPDIVRIRMYYNNVIYEGFMEGLQYAESAATPNITYNFNFIVEREFLSASFSNVPSSLINNGTNPTLIGKPGTLDPTKNTTSVNPPNLYKTTTTTTILNTGATLTSSSVGSSGSQNLSTTGQGSINLPVQSNNLPTDSGQISDPTITADLKNTILKNNGL